jgi:hypothetical protein
LPVYKGLGALGLTIVACEAESSRISPRTRAAGGLGLIELRFKKCVEDAFKEFREMILVNDIEE